MTDIFDEKRICPMLLESAGRPFDSSDFIFEIKFDGARMIAYLDKNSTHLENRRLNAVNDVFPEFNALHKQVKEKCILDGEAVYIGEGGRPDFTGFQARNNAKNVALKMKKFPMTFVVFDILYFKDKQITELPLLERKSLLEKNVAESGDFCVIRFIENKGRALFDFTGEHELEGIVAKRKDSVYRIGKRSCNWLKIKHLKNEEFLVCGYVLNDEGRIRDLILCSETGNGFKDEGSVYLGMNKPEEKNILKFAAGNRLSAPLFTGKGTGVFWIKPELACEIEYLEKTHDGNRRHAVFKKLC